MLSPKFDAMLSSYLNRMERLPMSPRLTFAAVAVCLTALATPAPATDDQTGTPAATGSESVIVNGTPAKRAGDIPGAIFSPDVFVNGQPVIVGCTEGTPVLSPNVFVNGKPKILNCAK